MKLPLVLLALVAPLSLFAQEIVPGAEASVSIKLTMTYSQDVSYTEPTPTTLGVEVVKQVSERFVSSDLVADLIDQGVIDDTLENAKHWRLVLVNRHPLFNGEGGLDLHFYARRNVTRTLPAIAPVLIPDDILSVHFAGYGAESRTVKSNMSGIVSESGKFTQQMVVVYNNDMLDEAYLLRGIGKGSYSSGTVKIGTESFTFLKVGGLTISPIVGEFENTEESGNSAVITGSISFSPFKAIDISAYPAPVIVD